MAQIATLERGLPKPRVLSRRVIVPAVLFLASIAAYGLISRLAVNLPAPAAPVAPPKPDNRSLAAAYLALPTRSPAPAPTAKAEPTPTTPATAERTMLDASLDTPKVDGPTTDTPAVTDKTAPRPPRPEAAAVLAPGSTTDNMAKIGATLVGLIGVVFALAFAARKFLRGTRVMPGKERVLRIRDALPLGAQRTLYLIAVENRTLVVGASGGNLTLLSEYTSDDPAAGVSATANGTAVPEAAPVEDTVPASEPTPAALALALEITDTIETPSAVSIPRPAAPVAAHAAAAAAAPAPAAPLVVRPAASMPMPAPATAARAFPFHQLPADQMKKPDARRVPAKFRHLLENALAAEEGAK